MQGISNARHKRLNDALLLLEDLMNEGGYIADAKIMQVKRKQFEDSYSIYIDLLEKLSAHIFEYEELYVDIKVNTVGKKLSNLKKMIKPVNHDFVLLKEAIINYYGT